MSAFYPEVTSYRLMGLVAILKAAIRIQILEKYLAEIVKLLVSSVVLDSIYPISK